LAISETYIIRPGTLLLSEPFGQDPLFGRAVVLICQVNPEGTIGLILNKEAKCTPEFEDSECLSPFRFYEGGPVEKDLLFFIHKIEGLLESQSIKDGIFLQGNYDALLQAVDQKEFTPENGRFFLGYSGWETGQLEEEIDREEWMIYEGPIDFIFGIEPESIWKEVLQKMGPYYRMISNFPKDPTLN